jgi:hypothetical protein
MTYCVDHGVRRINNKTQFPARVRDFALARQRPNWLCDPYRRVPGVLRPGVKRLRREAGRLASPRNEVKNKWHYTSTPRRAIVV